MKNKIRIKGIKKEKVKDSRKGKNKREVDGNEDPV